MLVCAVEELASSNIEHAAHIGLMKRIVTEWVGIVCWAEDTSAASAASAAPSPLLL